MINEGRWQERKIVSQDWIRKITSTVTPVEIVNERNGLNSKNSFQFSYGYMWWVVDNFKKHPDFEGAYSANGFGGQFITVIPKLKLVVAHKVKLGLLERWGLRPGGVSDYNYWKLLYDFVRTH